MEKIANFEQKQIIKSEQENSEEEIIQEIYDNRKVYLIDGESGNIIEDVTEKDMVGEVFKHSDSDIIQFLLTYGSRELKVLEQGDQLRTYIKKIEGVDEKNQTTLLYKTAKLIMQNYVNKTAKEHHYRLQTSYEKMHRWAEKKGREIFKWDSPPPVEEIVDEHVEYDVAISPVAQFGKK